MGILPFEKVYFYKLQHLQNYISYFTPYLPKMQPYFSFFQVLQRYTFLKGEISMYGFTAKQIKTKGIISLVLAVGFLVFSIFAGEGLRLSSMNDIILVLLYPFVFTWMFFSILLNWKNMLKGFIKPIPFISFCIEYFKALLVMSPKALFWALTHKEG